MSIKNSLVASCRRILAPLTRILLRFGISAGEFNALVEQEYVKSAVRQIAAKNELVTSSRIAIITGLPRNLVASILESVDEESSRRMGSLIHRTQRVLTGWYEDSDFNTRDREPAVLPVAGADRSFEALVERYVGGGVRASGVLKELLSTGAVRMTRQDEVRAVRRSAAAGGADPHTVQQLGDTTAALLAAFEHNLGAGPEEQLTIHGVSRHADAQMVPVFRAQMAKHAEVLIESSEAFLEGRAVRLREGRPPASAEEVILGSFVFTCVQPVIEPTPRWQRGLAARLKDVAASRSAKD